MTADIWVFADRLGIADKPDWNRYFALRFSFKWTWCPRARNILSTIFRMKMTRGIFVPCGEALNSRFRFTEPLPWQTTLLTSNKLSFSNRQLREWMRITSKIKFLKVMPKDSFTSVSSHSLSEQMWLYIPEICQNHNRDRWSCHTTVPF